MRSLILLFRQLATLNLILMVSWATPSQPTGQLVYASNADRFARAAILPDSGAHELRIITPSLIEVYIVSSRDGAANRPTFCDWVDDSTSLLNADAPSISDIEVKIDGVLATISDLGFQRRVRFAPQNETEFRMENSLYLALSAAISNSSTVTVENPAGDKWPSDFVFTANLTPDRWSTAIHVNQVGYEATESKKAHVGQWLGSMGELSIAATTFEVIRTSNSTVAATGSLTQRSDSGFLYIPAPYQEVYEADFSTLVTPGEYQLRIPDLGTSLPFEIRSGIDGVLARTTVAGLFHQRSAQDHSLPYTRYIDGPSHTAPAEIPSNTDRAAFATMWDTIQGLSGGAITGPADLLYPFINTGTVDVSGGHMDAGDYSKYATNTAAALHTLTFAVDHLPGVSALDNLGLPESGDSISDLLQEAHYAATFLTKLQDADGGFYYIVRPKDRSFETDVLPSGGDTQVVYPKNTISTAVATAALAEIASSPAFQSAYPTEAAAAETAALDGWNFLMAALDTDSNGTITPVEKAAAYQKIAFYGDSFTHDDELAWAAAAMFVMTEGEPAYETRLKEFMPDPTNVLLNGWRRLHEGWGSAMRTYAFGIRSGRITNASGHDAAYLALVEVELEQAGDDVVTWTDSSAYGVAMPLKDKEFLVSAYHFAGNESFNALVASQLSPSNPSNPDYIDALRMNANYALGSNPNNIPYYTGLGWRRQREIVSQFSHNDSAVLPPIGLPIANISQSPPYLDTYLINGGNLLQRSLFPTEGIVYPFYERWTESFDVRTEHTINVMAREAAVASWLFVQTSVSTQSWNSASATISGLPSTVNVGTSTNVTLSSSLPTTGARITWEGTSIEPLHGGTTFTFSPEKPGPSQIAADVLFPDGRRMSALANYTAVLPVVNEIENYQSTPLTENLDAICWYALDGDFSDSLMRQGVLTPDSGAETFESAAFQWPSRANGEALSITGTGDGASVSLPDSLLDHNAATAFSIEAMLYVRGFPTTANVDFLRLFKTSDNQPNMRFGSSASSGLEMFAGFTKVMDDTALRPLFTLDTWHHLKIRLDQNGYTFSLNGNVIHTRSSGDFNVWGNYTGGKLAFGHFDGWIDEVVVKAEGATSDPFQSLPGTQVADYRFSSDGSDSTDQQGAVSTTGAADISSGFMCSTEVGDAALVQIPTKEIFDDEHSWGFAIEARIKIDAFSSAPGNARMLSLFRTPLARLELLRKSGASAASVEGGTAGTLIDSATLAPHLTLGEWHQIILQLDRDCYSVQIDGVEVASVATPSGELNRWATSGMTTLEAGNFDGCIDRIRITRIEPTTPGALAAHYAMLGDYADTSGTGQGDLTPVTNGTLNGVLRVRDLGDRARVTIPTADIYNPVTTEAITLEARILVDEFLNFGGSVGLNLVSLIRSPQARLLCYQETVTKNATLFGGMTGTLASAATLSNHLTVDTWHDLTFRLDQTAYTISVDSNVIATIPAPGALSQWDSSQDSLLLTGNFDGYVDHITVKRTDNGIESTVAEYNFDSLSDSSSPQQGDMTLFQNAQLSGFVNFVDIGDSLTVDIPNITFNDTPATQAVHLSADLYIISHKAGTNASPQQSAHLFRLEPNWNAKLSIFNANNAASPGFVGGANELIPPIDLGLLLTTGKLHSVVMTITKDLYRVWIDNVLALESPTSDFVNWDRNGGDPGNLNNAILEIGNFEGAVGNVRITSE